MNSSALGQQDKCPVVCRDACGSDDKLRNEALSADATALGYRLLCLLEVTVLGGLGERFWLSFVEAGVLVAQG